MSKYVVRYTTEFKLKDALYYSLKVSDEIPNFDTLSDALSVLKHDSEHSVNFAQMLGFRTTTETILEKEGVHLGGEQTKVYSENGELVFVIVRRIIEVDD